MVASRYDPQSIARKPAWLTVFAWGYEGSGHSTREVVAGRFTIERLTGRGGMGFIYRSPEVAYRFNREAVLLAELSHPGIVSYIAHGATEAGQPFLVMEWLGAVPPKVVRFRVPSRKALSSRKALDDAEPAGLDAR